MADHGHNHGQSFLPYDIICCIVDHCVKPSLRSLSLVSRQWRCPSQRALLGHIAIPKRTPSGAPIPSLLDVLDEDPNFCGYVTNMRVSAGRVTALDLLDVVARLPRIHTLIIDSTTIMPTFTNVPTAHWPSQMPMRKLFPPTGMKIGVLRLLYSSVLDTDEPTDEPWIPLFHVINIFDSVDEVMLDYLWLASLPDSRMDSPIYRDQTAPPSLTRSPPSSPPPSPSRSLLPSLLGLPNSKKRKTRVKELIYSPFPDDDFHSCAMVDLALEFIEMEYLESMKYIFWGGDRMTMYQALVTPAIRLKRISIEAGNFGGPDTRVLYMSTCPLLESVEFVMRLSNANLEKNVTQFRENMSLLLNLLTSLHPQNLRFNPAIVETPEGRLFNRTSAGFPHNHHDLSPLSQLSLRAQSTLVPLDSEDKLVGLVDSFEWSKLAHALKPFTQLVSVKVVFESELISDAEVIGGVDEDHGEGRTRWKTLDRLKAVFEGNLKRCAVKVGLATKQ